MARAQAGDTAAALKLAEKGMRHFEWHGIEPEYIELLLLMCQVAISKTATAASGFLGAAPVHADKMWERLQQVSHALTDRFQLFRVAMHILQLLDLELQQAPADASQYRPGNYPDPAIERLQFLDNGIHRQCLDSVLASIQELDFDKQDVDAMLLLRAFGLVAPYYPANPAVRALLTVRPLRQVILSEFADVPDELLEAGKLWMSRRAGRMVPFLLQNNLHMLRDVLLDGAILDREICFFALTIKQELKRLGDAQPKSSLGNWQHSWRGKARA